MRRNAFAALIILVAVGTILAACKVGQLAWAYGTDSSTSFKVFVKGALQNSGKTTIQSAVVKIDIFRKADNAKVTTMSATVTGLAAGAQESFTAGPAMVVRKGTNVPNTYYYKLQLPVVEH